MLEKTHLAVVSVIVLYQFIVVRSAIEEFVAGPRPGWSIMCQGSNMMLMETESTFLSPPTIPPNISPNNLHITTAEVPSPTNILILFGLKSSGTPEQAAHHIKTCDQAVGLPAPSGFQRPSTPALPSPIRAANDFSNSTERPSDDCKCDAWKPDENHEMMGWWGNGCRRCRVGGEKARKLR